jgi:protocatechuate 3,4-dioxygenase beta subunit
MPVPIQPCPLPVPPPRAVRVFTLALGLMLAAPLSAQSLTPTPEQPRGPFYPRQLPAERDPDLALFGDKAAQGTVVEVSGRILRRDGRPVGETLSGADGGFRFRTVRPATYPGRTPHLHFAVTPSGGRASNFQLYFADARENAGDFLLRDLTADQRTQVIREVGPDGKVAWDIVLP